MSNALLCILAQSQPTDGSAVPTAMLPFLAGGIFLLIAWVILRILRPAKFLLRNTPARPNTVNPLHIAVLFLIYQASMGLLAWILTGQRTIPNPWPPSLYVPLVLTPMLAQLVWLACSLAVASMTFRHGLRSGLGLTDRHFLTDSGRGVCTFLIALPLCVGAVVGMHWLFPNGPTHPFLVVLPSAGVGLMSLVVAASVIVAPVAEEIFFRGLLQSMFRRYLGGPWPAILISAAMFAAAHASLYRDWPALFVLAVALGYNYERTGRLTSCMIAHAIFNAINIYGTRLG
jgi:membrane protease YdiL (CAAX protease family)